MKKFWNKLGYFGLGISEAKAVYGSPHFHQRHLLWDHLSSLSSIVSEPWLVLGDFNQVLCQEKIVEEAWRKGSPCVVRGLKEVQYDATKFNKEVFGNIFVRKRKLEWEISKVQQLLTENDSKDLRQKENDLQKEFNTILL
ncbi:hypothetical protein PIB30_079706 [Stylosanthes scabra]|uniref:Endonuclease/exonuclease/phosphatase n=1 Tax=Stylosanthes scabra TaxID=79078 RepID=A0ABU6VQD3_9FABA|nr:hypothetical protein [Stylosanthes scabra]